MGAYLNVKDIMQILKVPKFRAYQVIRDLNRKLTAQGYITIAGKVPTKAFLNMQSLTTA